MNMAMFDVIKWNVSEDTELLWKFPSEEIPLGSQLIVSSTQQCIFRKGGKTVAVFDSGTHTLTSANLPIANKLINLPFGGKTPFSAEIWFVSKTPKRNLKWGTSSPIQIVDPGSRVRVSVRAFGQWGVRVTDALVFIEELIGTRAIATTDEVYDYFRGELVQEISEKISRYITEKKLPVLELNSWLRDISQEGSEDLKSSLIRYGIELTNLTLDRVSIPEEELQHLQNVDLQRYEVEQLGSTQVTDSYKTIKALDALQMAASNEGGGVGALAAQVGLGAALGVSAANHSSSAIGTEKLSKDEIFDSLKKLKDLLDIGVLTQEEFLAKKTEILAKL